MSHVLASSPGPWPSDDSQQELACTDSLELGEEGTEKIEEGNYLNLPTQVSEKRKPAPASEPSLWPSYVPAKELAGRDSLELLEKRQRKIDERRTVEILELVAGSHKDIPIKYLMNIVLGIAVTLACVFTGLNLFPLHDIMEHPTSWWECMLIQCNVGCFSLAAWAFLTTTTALINLDGVFNWNNWLKTYLIGSLTNTAVWLAQMVVWVYILGYRYPVPMIGLWSTGCGLTAQGVSCWFQLPRHWLQSGAFRKRVRSALTSHFLTVIITLFYCGCWLAFTIVPNKQQPILALLLPVFREVFGYIQETIGQKGGR